MNSANFSIYGNNISPKNAWAKVLITGIAVLFLTGCAASGGGRSTGQVIDDASVASRVKSALLADRDTDGLDIEVETYRGRVQLIGFVESQLEINRAQEIARNTAGVNQVSSALIIVGDSRRVGEYIDDTVLLTRITRALARDPIASALGIEVEVNRGVVILGGFVDSVLERDTAGQVTQAVDGVERTLNNLQIR